MTRLHTAYLTGSQLNVWDLLRKGLSQSEIARRLGITRQSVNELAQTIPEKVTAALSDAAELNGVEPKYIDGVKGLLLGWSSEFRTETIIIFNPQQGLRTWYYHDLGRCKICDDKKECESRLRKTAKYLDVELSREEKRMEPQKLASLIFSRATGRASPEPSN